MMTWPQKIAERQWKKGRSVTHTSLPKKDARDADTGFTVVDLNKNLA
jgi:hypothetical protein